MRDKGFGTLLTLGIITVLTGCDNVAFGGFQVELRPPPEIVVVEEVEAGTEPAEPAIEPLELGPILYFVERGEGSQARLVPVAEMVGDRYATLPDSSAVPDMALRFPVGRFEPGSEFTLFARGVRAGTFVAGGPSGFDTSTCQARLAAEGRVELLPEAVSHRRFLAMPRGEVPAAALGAFDPRAEDAALRAAALDLAQRLIEEMSVPVPPSIPNTRRDLQPTNLDGSGREALAATYVYGDELVVGPSTRLAYSLFVLAERQGTRYDPVLASYQRFERDGKAFPRLLGAHDVTAGGRPDVLLELFGESERWLAVLGAREGGDFEVLYEDPCGDVSVSADGVWTFP